MNHDQLIEQWGGCCCQCKLQFTVHKSCANSPRENESDGCICNQPTGMFVCIAAHQMGESQTCNVGREHSYCEMFDKRTDSDK